MKKFVLFIFLAFFSIFNAQLKNVDVVDFYNWTASNGTHYDFMLISEKFEGLNQEIPALVRVKYSLDGGATTNIAEYDAVITLDYNSKDDDLVLNLIAGKTARIIKGKNGYSPDNFILYYSAKGDYLKGFQADENEMAKDNVTYSKVFKTDFKIEDLRTLIKLYFKPGDRLYPDLMKYAAKYD